MHSWFAVDGIEQKYIAKIFKRNKQGSGKSRMQDHIGGWNLKVLMMCRVHAIDNVKKILLSVLWENLFSLPILLHISLSFVE